MFANGTEYECFLAANCDHCQHFVEWDEATDDEPMCFVEERIAEAMHDESAFPYEWLDKNKHISRYDCRRKNGLDASKL